MGRPGAVLVTSDAGFIGFHPSRKILGAGYSAIGLDNLNHYCDIGLKHSKLKILTSYKNFNFSEIDPGSAEELEKLYKKHKFTYFH